MSSHDRPRAGRFLASFALVALMGAGCGRSGTQAVDESRAAAERFLGEVREGRFQPAWDGGSTEFKSLMGVETLRDLVKAHPALKSPAEFAESRAIERDGLAQSECVFRATAKVRGKPVTATIKVLVAPDADGWKVERLSVE
ncbi:hypothetical protein [Paludisphaera soli]|uniref:hypothetical protein n=1 Tax=Paludisphaera soli TaxID=2712865 RepID=UPI0013EAF743|nr:hypothetical protein [Paludisphaera soli]